MKHSQRKSGRVDPLCGCKRWMNVDCETVVHSDGKCSNHVYEFHLALRLGHSGAALGKGAWVIRLCVCKLDTTDRMLARAAGTVLGELV